jgi:enediyne biosynthesis protein E4
MTVLRPRLATWLALALVGGAVALGAAFYPWGASTGSDPPDAEGRDGPPLPDLFRDVTGPSGINFTYRNGEEAGHYAILETLGGGVALLDYDGDGLLDVFVPGGGSYEGPDKQTIRGRPSRLYRNLGGLKFEDVTDRVLPAQSLFYSHGAAVCDFDRDGWPDLLVTGYGRLALYHNRPAPGGGRQLVEVTAEVGLGGDQGWCTSAAWADLDGDGWPDLYLCRYVNWSFSNHPVCSEHLPHVRREVCSPRQFEPLPHAVFRNVPGPGGSRRFLDVSREAGLRVPPAEAKDFGKGLGVVAVDVNGDGRPDLYVANDTTGNFLYLNRSAPGRIRLEEVGMPLGVARDVNGIPNGSMGVDAADYEGHGLPALWVTNYESEMHALYRNVMRNGRQYFAYATHKAGIAVLGRRNVGWGTRFVDVDLDGREDLAITHGHVIRHPKQAPLRQKPVLLWNRGDGTFANISARGGPFFQADHLGRGLAVGDLDNDGRPDLVISHVNDPVAVLWHAADLRRHWLGVELVGRDRRDVVGARLTLEVGGRKLTRFARGGGSFLSTNDPRILFGLGDSPQPGALTVEWPSGEPRLQRFEGLAADRYWRLVQGEPAAQPPRGVGR